MKSFDELLAMSDEEKAEYLQQEINAIIEQAADNKKLPLQAFQAKLLRQLDKYGSNHQVRMQVACMAMMEKLNELNSRFAEFGLGLSDKNRGLKDV